MCEITATELKRNFGKYVELGQKEEIVVTHRGKQIFTIVPKKMDLLKRMESYFGILPEEALEEHEKKEIEREWLLKYFLIRM